MDRIGRYKIVRELGRGAMGVVYHAIDPNIGRPVAIKTIHLGEVLNAEEQKRLRERLFREARSAGILSHPGIVTIYDVAEQEGLAYIAMEYVDGPTLDQKLSASQPLTSDQIFSILAQTANALDYAHQKGIVHRDIKPANIMIAADGTAKITDFGIAKITTSEQFTMTGSIVGTPHYMSPEQVQGQPVDGRSDQFSLGVIAYEMLTGEKPYTGEHLTTVVYKIVAEEPAIPHRINPSLSAGIDNVLRKVLAKKPDGRYRTCSEFSEALEKACAAARNWKAMPRGGSLNEPTIADVPRPGAMMPMPAARRPHRAADTSTAERSKKKSGFLPFLAAVVMAAALLALIGWQAAPWLMSNQARSQATESHAAKPAVDTPSPQSSAAPPLAAAPVPPADPADAKPSPMSPAPPKPDAGGKTGEVATAPGEATPAAPPTTSQPGGEPAAPLAAGKPANSTGGAGRPGPPAVQPVAILSSPGGATATMDERPDAACKTPCSLDAAPGRHRISLVIPGYGVEHREFNVGTEPLELPMVILRAQTGDLMLTSVPSGATVIINGKKMEQTTPAQLHLAPGNYKITVERDGREASSSVDIRTGDVKTLRITLGQ